MLMVQKNRGEITVEEVGEGDFLFFWQLVSFPFPFCCHCHVPGTDCGMASFSHLPVLDSCNILNFWGAEFPLGFVEQMYRDIDQMSFSWPLLCLRLRDDKPSIKHGKRGGKSELRMKDMVWED